MAAPKKYQYIDSFRGLAILLVMLVHVAYMYDNQVIEYLPSYIHQFIRNNKLSVQLFFMVSALTLSMSWNNRADESKRLTKFFIRRFFRIAPLFYIGIIYYSFDRFLGFDLMNIDWGDLPKKMMLTSFLFINGFFPTYINGYVPGGWSITVEFTFYALVPFFFKRIKSLNQSLSYLFVLLIICYFTNTYVLGSLTSNSEFLYYNIVSQIPIFLYGITSYWIINAKESDLPLSRFNLSMMVLIIFLFSYFTLPFHYWGSLIWLILIVVQSKEPFRILSNFVLAGIGKVSFSMYLIHFTIISSLEKLGWLDWFPATNAFTTVIYIVLSYLVVFLFTFLIANLTYKYIELPGMDLGKKLVKKLDK